jgi:uncharacterized protein YciI
MDFDNYTITLLIRRADAPQLSDERAGELQDAHLSHLADLAEAGLLLAAGPLSATASTPVYRSSMSIGRKHSNSSWPTRLCRPASWLLLRTGLDRGSLRN